MCGGIIPRLGVLAKMGLKECDWIGAVLALTRHHPNVCCHRGAPNKVKRPGARASAAANYPEPQQTDGFP